jgi:Flp pilus assembly protein TadD/mono/diheme cytochrome c family protein
MAIVPLSASAQTVTFTRDMAPLFFSRCATCHQPGGPAPFSLLTYESARQRATQIAEATRRRLMPPWRARSDYGAFVGQHPLTEREIDLIQRWVEQGAVEGETAALPPSPTRADGWQLGKPDLVVTTAAYTLPAEGTDVFRIFVVPLPVSSAKYVKGVEFRPGNPKVVHHANIRIDRTRGSRRYDEGDPAPGYEGLIPHSATYPDGHFLGWTPGQVAPLLPKGLAWRLERESDLVVEVHMQPSGKPEIVQPAIGLFFGEDAPERTPLMVRLGRQSIDIAPADARYTIADAFTLPVDAEVHAVQPHAHYRAREVHGTATLPDGTVRTLIRLDDWDFRWQHVYRFAAPFWLPKGTTLAMRYVYDNSADNPRNPQRPPQRATWGQRSRDEMGDLWIQVLTRSPRDLDTLTSHVRPKVIAEDIVGYEMVIKANPDSVELHDDVAMLYFGVGRPADALRHFEASAMLKPDSAAAHFNVGTALAVLGRQEAAAERYERALAIKPDYPQAHNNLGSILLKQGRLAEAFAHLFEAIRLDPANTEARFNLAETHAAAGQLDKAIDTAQAALELSPAEPLRSALRDRLGVYRQQLERR